jgi:rubrerythrin
MIILKKKTINSLESLRHAIQQAIELEHATIPTYLTANYSLVHTHNDEIYSIIRSVVIEEMLHLSIACNLLTSIGGSPVLNKPDFVPNYPGPLPGGVESGLIVPLAKFSKDLIKNVFMRIEQPEHPVEIEHVKQQLPDGEITIGDFYAEVLSSIVSLEEQAQAAGKTIFTGKSEFQMVDNNWFPSNELFAIHDVATATKAIHVIVDQGEGNSSDPFVNPADSDPNAPPELAHYYRFEEIYEGRELVADDNHPKGYSFTGKKIPFNPNYIPNMKENPKMENYPPDSKAYTFSKLFNYNYTSLLNCLHKAFNGQPEQINTAMGLMYELRLYALKLLNTPDPNNPGYVAGPSFEYVTSDDLTEEEKSILYSVE